MSESMQAHLLIKLKNIAALVVTDTEKQKSQINGELLFSIKSENNDMALTIEEVNLTATSVSAKEANTGQLSINLRKQEPAKFSQDGKFEASFQTNLHYPLIDKQRGYQKTETENQDYFVPFVDTAVGRFRGQIMDKIDISGDKSHQQRVKLTLNLDLVAEEFPWVKEITVDDFMTTATLIQLFGFCKKLPIQPVFIRSGRTDTSPSGWSFDTMMQSAKCIWRKCCIFFNVLPPIYVDKARYKVLGTTEVYNLLNEVPQSNAVAIFVAESMSTSLYTSWGGGATFGSGTANAQIVTSDAQLRVPDPSHPGHFLGAINVNHLAHELGHVMGLTHPSVAANPPMTGTGTAGTVLEGSGFYKDNPHSQSENNCTQVGNPLFAITLMRWESRCIRNPEIP